MTAPSHRIALDRPRLLAWPGGKLKSTSSRGLLSNFFHCRRSVSDAGRRPNASLGRLLAAARLAVAATLKTRSAAGLQDTLSALDHCVSMSRPAGPGQLVPESNGPDSQTVVGCPAWQLWSAAQIWVAYRLAR